MITYCIANLKELKRLVEKLKEENYIKPLKLLSNASLGQHVRHILEFYICVMKGIDNKRISYDSRERDPDLEKNIGYVLNEIDKINKWLDGIKENGTITLKGNFSSEDLKELAIESSIYRELAYCYEHSIHHQALIKIGLKELEIEYLIDDDFGVAPSTIRFNSSCAQ